MSNKNGYTQYLYQDLAQVTALTGTGATCTTTYGSIITIRWAWSKPDPLPKIGENWYIEEFTSARWRFVCKANSDTYSRLSYWLDVDGFAAIGRERPIVDDIVTSDFDGVYLTVAADGRVLWKSTVATDYGLIVDSDHLSQLMSRLSNAGVAVVFVVASDLWNDASNATQNAYQQATIDSTGKVTPIERISYSGAQSAVVSLISELYTSYETMAQGVCFTDFREGGQYADFSAAATSAFIKDGGEIPSWGLASYDGTDGWWARRKKWDAFQASQQEAFLDAIRDVVGSWSVGIMAPDKVACVGDGSEQLGCMSTGLNDSLGDQGWSRVGFPLSYQRGADNASAMRAAESIIAYGIRLAGDSLFVPEIDLDWVDSFGALFALLAKYGVTEVVVSSYSKWQMLSDNDVLSLSSAMDEYRVSAISSLDAIGVVVSSDTEEIAYYGKDESIQYREIFVDVCSQLLNRLPHKLQVFFDSDIESLSSFTGVSVFVLCDVQNMSDDAVSEVLSVITTGAQRVVLYGRSGIYAEDSLEERSSDPFAGTFSEAFYGERVYSDYLEFGGNVAGGDVKYALMADSNGSVPVLGEAIAESVSSDKSATAPLMVDNRNAYFAIDPGEDDMLVPIVGELALYAMGRDDE